MYQALEQLYNKPAKGHGGIIGLTRRKQAVAQEMFVDKSKKIFDKVAKMKMSCSRKHMKNIGVARETEYSIDKLLCYKLVSSSFFLTKDGFLRKPDKAVAWNAKRIIIASSDTDVFVCAVYHFFKSFKKEGLSEVCGQGNTSRVLPIHRLGEDLDHSTIEILPPLHAITGCDTTIKFGTKLTALKHGKLSPYLLFGKTDLCEAMIDDADEFLVGVPSSNFTSGNKLRVHRYHQMKRLDLKKLPQPSSSIRLHMKRRNTARLARRSDEALGMRVSVARIAPSLLFLERAGT
ncbi:hypothetical protein PR048_002264 [Dryococelus australis]|uniref:Uncharacterized protein n=1 Tax=Dryococelus australis TaxID=614101 RepID=A0ABQ9IM72_9NEOP|nr:hypothetical protein PR048_002264 [Dryococelus australis]